MRRLALLLVIAGCSAPLSTLEREPAADDPRLPMAKLFDDLLQNKLHSEQQAQLEANCAATPQASIFCHGIVHRAALQAKVAQSLKDAQPAKYRGPRYYPSFSKSGELLNWTELRSAPVPGLLRSLPKSQPKRMAKLKSAALLETQCPNSASIAIAAVLEDRLPQAVTYDEVGRLYEKGAACLGENPGDQESAYTRAGLMYLAKKDYPLAKEALTQASQVKGTFVGRPLYWLYRTQLALEEKSAAAKTLKDLQTRYPFSFHSLIAQTSSGKDPGELLTLNASAATTRSRNEAEVNLLLEQVEVLRLFGFDASASTVLDWAVVSSSRDIEPEVMLYIAELKKEQGDYKTKIIILSDVLYQNPSLISRKTLELYFPKVLFPIFEKHSAVVDPYFLLAIARRESAFNPNAVSSANAQGLLQVLPGTGRRLRKKRPNLFDPETNVAVGAKYIAELLKRTDGQVHLALAAYNAGPGKLKGWTRQYPTDDPILFTDLIPFKETREYVGSVLRNYYWYRRIHQTNQPIPSEKILELAIAEKSD